MKSTILALTLVSCATTIPISLRQHCYDDLQVSREACYYLAEYIEKEQYGLTTAGKNFWQCWDNADIRFNECITEELNK